MEIFWFLFLINVFLYKRERVWVLINILLNWLFLENSGLLDNSFFFRGCSGVYICVEKYLGLCIKIYVDSFVMLLFNDYGFFNLLLLFYFFW